MNGIALTAAVLLVSGIVLYALINRTLRSQFDHSLAARARALGGYEDMKKAASA